MIYLLFLPTWVVPRLVTVDELRIGTIHYSTMLMFIPNSALDLNDKNLPLAMMANKAIQVKLSTLFMLNYSQTNTIFTELLRLTADAFWVEGLFIQHQVLTEHRKVPFDSPF